MLYILQTYGRILSEAMGQTLLLAVLSLVFATILGIIFGILGVVNNKACNWIERIFADAIRGVPLIVLAFMIYFGIPQVINSAFDLSSRFTLTALQAGTISLALNSGAYMAEIIRAGILSVPKGQMEASRSLGLSYMTSMRQIILPQAIRVMIPTIINQFIITLKDTSILAMIGFPELVNKARSVISIDATKIFYVWAVVAIMYLVVILALSYTSKALERRLDNGSRKRHN